MDFDYTEVEKYLAVSLSRFRIMLPDLWEDALQEGLIQAWRDVEAGVEPKLKVLRRAKLKAKSYFNRNGEHSFGKPKVSRAGLRRDSTVIDKVTTYLDEFVPVYDRVPQGTEVAKALGISPASASLALKNIREGRIDHMKYREDGRKDWDHYKVVSLQAFDGSGDAGVGIYGARNSNTGWEENQIITPHIDSPSFEESSVAYMDVISVMKKLAPHHQEVLYLHLFQGYNTGDIGRHLGYTKNISQLGNKAILNAVNQARIALDPYFGKCSAGHTRSEENTLVKLKETGIYNRYCQTCNKAKAAKTNGKS